MTNDSMLKFYSIFHLNLMYSSIAVEDRKKVIDLCYSPLLDLIDEGYPLALEPTAVTLEIIAEESPEWIHRFRLQVEAGICELIGSGYAQLIGPLVPDSVNRWNLSIGETIYQNLLGTTPKIAMINEMSYSGGLVHNYNVAGYEGVIMEWNNPRRFHPEWDKNQRYFPQTISGPGGETTKVLWADSIAFQKFQRYSHRETPLDEYVGYLHDHASTTNRFFPLYTNDVEIFDYRPGRFKTEEALHHGSEWDRIRLLYKTLDEATWAEHVLPSQVLSSPDGNSYPIIRLESPEQPIPVKKQEKYNITRWALTGRNDVLINTDCFRLFQQMSEQGCHDYGEWKDLCFLWSSDFRTHIENNRWLDYQKLMSKKLQEWQLPSASAEKPPSFTGVIKNQQADTENNPTLMLGNDMIAVELIKRKGLTIKALAFKACSKKPLIGTLEHGYYEDISFGADFYSGHFSLERANQHKLTDLSHLPYQVSGLAPEYERVMTSDENSSLRYTKTMEVQGHKFIMDLWLDFPIREYGTIRLGNFTFLPDAWDSESLYFATHNGGPELEEFSLKDTHFNHLDILSALVSSKHGLGVTNGVMIIGDKFKSVTIKHDPSILAMIPSVIFQRLSEDEFFLRVIYSIQESDETFREAAICQNFHAQWTLTMNKL
jgi:hypothetical protein